MGTSFSTIQIKNKHKSEPAQFQKMFCEYMENKGLIPAADEDAELSYRLAFSDKSDWVTLCFAEDDVGSVHEDAPKLAEMFRTHCVITSVWDSDMFELYLFGASADERDTISAGRLMSVAERQEVRRRWKPTRRPEAKRLRSIQR